MLTQRGEMAIVLVEQYHDSAAGPADQFLVMERGEIVARDRGADMQTAAVRERIAV